MRPGVPSRHGACDFAPRWRRTPVRCVVASVAGPARRGTGSDGKLRKCCRGLVRGLLLALGRLLPGGHRAGLFGLRTFPRPGGVYTLVPGAWRMCGSLGDGDHGGGAGCRGVSWPRGVQCALAVRSGASRRGRGGGGGRAGCGCRRGGCFPSGTCSRTRTGGGRNRTAVVDVGMKTGWGLLGGALVLLSCAQVSSPTGGPVDTEPPKVVSGVPAYGTTGVRPEALVLTFDEYVVARNATAQLLISPPVKTPCTPVVRGKTVTLPLPAEDLAPGTTYVVSFGDGIVDLHEGLPASGVQWAFSTGDQLDTLAISGRVVDRTSGSGVAGIRAWAYPVSTPRDSILSGITPGRTAVTDAEGRFDLRHLPAGEFWVQAVQDADRNYRWSETEAVALLERPVSTGDSTVHRLTLDLRPAAPALQSASSDSTGFTRIALTGGPGVELVPVPTAAGVQLYRWPADSAWAWAEGGAVPPVRWALTGVDTVEVRPPRRSAELTLELWGARRDSLPAHRRLQGAVPASPRREVQWNRPISEIDPTGWSLTRDSTAIACTFSSGRFPGTTAWSLPEEVPGAYRLRILPGAAVGVGNVVLGDTVVVQWEVRGPEAWAELVVVPETDFPSGWLEVRSASGEVLAAQPVGPEVRRVAFPGLAPGPAALALRVDRNGNGQWDGVDPASWRAPEPVWHGGIAMELRANWVLEAVWPAAAGTDVP